MDAHLVFDRAAAHRVALAERAVAGHAHLGHDEQRDAAAALRCVGQAGQHEMHDVVGEVVLTGGDEDLGAGDRIAVVTERFGAGLEQAEIGAALRLGQAHRAGPGAGDQRLEEDLLLPGLAVVMQRVDRAVRQQRKVAPGEVRRVDHFFQADADGMRHVHAAEFGRCAHAGPAAIGELVIRRLEAVGRRHRAGGLVETHALFVADAVERGEHGFAHARALVEHGIDRLAVGVVEAERGEQGRHLQDVVQGEADVVQRGGVGAHRVGSSVSAHGDARRAGSIGKVRCGRGVSASRRAGPAPG